MASEKFKPPQVGLGEPVLWYPGPGDYEPAPALVTKVGTLALSLFILPVNSRGGIPVDGVHHKDDPGNATRLNDQGVWEHTPLGKQVRALLASAGKGK
jgi:hypothetical protein